MARYKSYLCGPTTCPNDPEFVHDNYFGCVPRTFSPTTGKAKGYRQVKTNVPAPGIPGEYRWKWDHGGCDPAVLDKGEPR